MALEQLRACVRARARACVCVCVIVLMLVASLLSAHSPYSTLVVNATVSMEMRLTHNNPPHTFPQSEHRHTHTHLHAHTDTHRHTHTRVAK